MSVKYQITFLNNLFHLIYPWRASNKQFFIIRSCAQAAHSTSPCFLWGV